MGDDDVFLGFDFSTQQVKVVAISEKLQVIYEDAIKFDDITKYQTSGGCHIHADGLSVTAPTVMWAEALDELLSKMKRADFDFSQVKGISGAGQQHGSVYWKTGGESKLRNLDPSGTFAAQLESCFSVPDSPIWMDSSTSKQCQILESLVGGPQAMADLTGSRAYERFTGNQILKVIQNNPEAYENTERISLVSSFAASLFLGCYGNIDESDGSGMNLMDLHSRQWVEALIKGCSADLVGKLGETKPSTCVQGPVSNYLVERYGFTSTCQVVSFTGDNPASLAGMCLGSKDVAVSLGSSDVIFLWLREPKPTTEGHIFVNPIVSSDYMALLCFKNGSLTREAIRGKHASDDWTEFERLLDETQIGNNGNIGLYYTICEIVPDNVEGCYYFDADDRLLDDFSAAVHVRALVEGQFLARRIHAEDMGFKFDGDCRILATGGASSNKAILQVMSDVFQAPVYTQDVANSAALGGAFLAMHATRVSADGLSFQDRMSDGPEFKLAATPQTDCKQIYDSMAARYRQLEQRVTHTLSRK